jgi:hypothetical protein
VDEGTKINIPTTTKKAAYSIGSYQRQPDHTLSFTTAATTKRYTPGQMLVKEKDGTLRLSEEKRTYAATAGTTTVRPTRSSGSKANFFEAVAANRGSTVTPRTTVVTPATSSVAPPQRVTTPSPSRTPTTTARPLPAATTMRIKAYSETGNNIVIQENTEQMLRQLSSTLRGLTNTVVGLNKTIMEATRDLRVPPEVNPELAISSDEDGGVSSLAQLEMVEMIAFMQAEIIDLSRTVRELRDKNGGHHGHDNKVSKEEVREVLLEVVHEAQKVARLEADLSEAVDVAKAKPPIKKKKKSKFQGVQAVPDGSTAYATPASPSRASVSVVGNDGVRTHYASDVEWQTLPAKKPTSSSVQDKVGSQNGGAVSYNIPVSASIGSGASIQVSSGPTKVETVVGTSMPSTVGSSFVVHQDGSIETIKLGDGGKGLSGSSSYQTSSNSFGTGGGGASFSVGSGGGYKAPSVSFASTTTATPKPLRHSFRPQQAADSFLTAPSGFVKGGSYVVGTATPVAVEAHDRSPSASVVRTLTPSPLTATATPATFTASPSAVAAGAYGSTPSSVQVSSLGGGGGNVYNGTRIIIIINEIQYN